MLAKLPAKTPTTRRKTASKTQALADLTNGDGPATAVPVRPAACPTSPARQPEQPNSRCFLFCCRVMWWPS